MLSGHLQCNAALNIAEFTIQQNLSSILLRNIRIFIRCLFEFMLMNLQNMTKIMFLADSYHFYALIT